MQTHPASYFFLICIKFDLTVVCSHAVFPFPLFFFFFFLVKRIVIYMYSKATLYMFINSYSSLFGLLFIWSAYRDAKFKMENDIKRSLLRDVIRDLGTWYVYRGTDKGVNDKIFWHRCNLRKSLSGMQENLGRLRISIPGFNLRFPYLVCKITFDSSCSLSCLPTHSDKWFSLQEKSFLRLGANSVTRADHFSEERQTPFWQSCPPLIVQNST